MRIFISLILTSVILLTISINAISQDNKNLFFVFLNSNPEKVQISETEAEKLQAAHLENIKKLKNEGKLVAAGPFEGGGGMFILRAENLEEANSILATDQAIAANRFNIEVFPFNIFNGNLCGATEPYEMIEYQFVRIITDDSDSELSYSAMRDTRYFMSELHNVTGELIVHGKFNNENDGILILNVPDAPSVDNIMERNPSVENGVISYDTKTLWIAKGTFCEK